MLLEGCALGDCLLQTHSRLGNQKEAGRQEAEPRAVALHQSLPAPLCLSQALVRQAPLTWGQVQPNANPDVASLGQDVTVSHPLQHW